MTGASPPTDDAGRSRRIDDDGFVVWPDLVDHALIDAHLHAYEGWLASAAPDRLGRLDRIAAEYDWHDDAPTAQDLFWNPDLATFLTGHFGAEPALRAPQTGLVQRGSDLHADGLSAWVEPAGAELRAWIALEDVDPAAGPVYFVPGTHHSVVATLHDTVLDGRPDLVRVLAEADWDAWDLSPPPPAVDVFAATGATAHRLVRERRLPRVVPTLAKGDAVVFRTDVLHGTFPCADAGRTRKHALAFYSAAGARWHDARTYYGRHFDRRTPDNALDWPAERTPRGLRLRRWPPDLRDPDRRRPGAAGAGHPGAGR